MHLSNDAVTVGNIFGTPDVEYLSVPSSHSLDVFSILKYSSLESRLYFYKQLEVIWNQVGGGGDRVCVPFQ
jgi:hypothetical protein